MHNCPSARALSVSQAIRITHVIPRIDQEAAGPSYSVPRLCQALAARGNDVELCCIAARGEIPGVRLDIHREWPLLRRFAISASLAWALRHTALEVDIVHNHSLWSMANVACGLIVPTRQAKLVTSPRGTLAPWALNRNRHLKLLLKPLQWRALERADLLHATSEMELADIRELKLRVPVALVPNGIDIPLLDELKASPDGQTLLFLSRIHPKKGIDRLLLAWKRLQNDYSEWRLRIVGNGDRRHVDQLRNLAISLDLERVEFSGPLFGEAKSMAYRSADVFVLPSHSENFGMVVAEALAHGCPVIASKGTPWKDLERHECGWWTAHDVDSLADALEHSMLLSRAELKQMGLRGRAWMLRDFSWESVAQKMEAAYRWTLGQATGERPECIRIG